MSRRENLPSLKNWRHRRLGSDHDEYSIGLSSDGKFVDVPLSFNRSHGQYIPEPNEMVYLIVRDRDAWHVEFETSSQTEFLDEDGLSVGEPGSRFSSAKKAFAAANKHWRSLSRFYFKD